MRGDGWKAYGHPGGGIGEFNDPRGIALDAKGRIYIADFGNNRIVRIDNMNGRNWVSFGTHGSGIGEFAGPISIAIH
ncbi:MAG: hypothetical protein M1169_04405, partial [Firmicutes bacterium]|nr:hypothetical protein [Bacillota bacterium]